VAGGEVVRLRGQHLQIQAFGLCQSSAAVQRDRLFAESLAVHCTDGIPSGVCKSNGDRHANFSPPRCHGPDGRRHRCGSAGPALAAASPVIEWNMHMFSSNTAKFPFSPRGTYKPDTARLSADPLVDYQAHLKEAGIDRALFVHPEPYGDDHTLVLDCLARTSPPSSRAPACSSQG